MSFEETFCHAWQPNVVADEAEIKERKKLADMVKIPEEIQKRMGMEFAKGVEHQPITRLKKSVVKPDTYYIIIRKEPVYRHVVEFKLDGTAVVNKRTDGVEAEAVCSYDEATKTWTSTLSYPSLGIPPMVSVRRHCDKGQVVHVEDTCGSDIKVTTTLAKVPIIPSAEDDAL